DRASSLRPLSVPDSADISVTGLRRKSSCRVGMASSRYGGASEVRHSALLGVLHLAGWPVNTSSIRRLIEPFELPSPTLSRSPGPAVVCGLASEGTDHMASDVRAVPYDGGSMLLMEYEAGRRNRRLVDAALFGFMSLMAAAAAVIAETATSEDEELGQAVITV